MITSTTETKIPIKFTKDAVVRVAVYVVVAVGVAAVAVVDIFLLV